MALVILLLLVVTLGHSDSRDPAPLYLTAIRGKTASWRPFSCPVSWLHSGQMQCLQVHVLPYAARSDGINQIVMRKSCFTLLYCVVIHHSLTADGQTIGAWPETSRLHMHKEEHGGCRRFERPICVISFMGE